MAPLPADGLNPLYILFAPFSRYNAYMAGAKMTEKSAPVADDTSSAAGLEEGAAAAAMRHFKADFAVTAGVCVAIVLMVTAVICVFSHFWRRILGRRVGGMAGARKMDRKGDNNNDIRSNSNINNKNDSGNTNNNNNNIITNNEKNDPGEKKGEAWSAPRFDVLPSCPNSDIQLLPPSFPQAAPSDVCPDLCYDNHPPGIPRPRENWDNYSDATLGWFEGDIDRPSRIAHFMDQL
ncbi:hypothetical protein SAMD00023353_0203410 [Rosellinia necatrix]|uniref:Uncharacterized protein n=1 Tax=Rosellinia necatrix TaxID=77044 RepID=A0A1W2TNX9_ROSNE|nr:hypothetical protein SAMD00023353_0203410 [Rosellinia necatrix]